MKQIVTQGINHLDPLPGSGGWYWGTDYIHGDLYEAEMLFRSGHPVRQNRLILVRYPEGAVVEPIRAEPGQYLGRPVCHDGQVIFLLVDFPRSEIRIIGFDLTVGQTVHLAVLPLSIAEDCYNLLLEGPPLMLTRSPHDSRFQILWPHRREFTLEEHESFSCLEGDRLYTTVWYEDPDYREEILERDAATGAVLKRTSGSIQPMPGRQHWALI